MHLATILTIVSPSLADIWPDQPVDKSTPVGVHLGIGSSRSMNVGWASYAKPNSSVCVRYGRNAENLTQTSCSNNSITYGTSRVWYNQVELNELEPSKLYYYRINSTNSTTYNFTMPHQPGDSTPYSVAALGDLGFHSFSGSKVDTHETVYRWINMSNEYDFTLYAGDYAYADNFLLNAEDLAGYFTGEDAYQSLIERYHHLISPLTSSQPLMLTPGNHEATCLEMEPLNLLCPQSQRNFTDVSHRYRGMFPKGYDPISNNADANTNRTKAQELALPPFWYSFDSGLVHYVFINTETDFEGAPDEVGAGNGLDAGPFGYDGQQLEWLEADLASVDRSITPWVILVGHRPWYTTSPADNRCESCMEAFEDTLFHYGVDLVIMGHVHNSQRFRPIYKDIPDPNGYKNPKAPMYIIAGGTGNIEGFDPADTITWTPGLDYANGKEFAFAIIDIKNSTNLGIRFVNSANGTAIDESELTKTHSIRFVRQ